MISILRSKIDGIEMPGWKRPNICTHMAQMIGYLAITQMRLAILINFKDATLRWKRVVR